MLIHWIWLATRENLTDRGRRLLLERFGDAEDVFFAQAEQFEAVEGLSAEAVASLREKSLTQAEKILSDCNREHIRVLTWQDASYPKRLKNIADPPTVLYYKGRLPEFDALPLIAVVGTRDASAYGLSTAKRMGYQIAACGGIVVSGMAYGIDGMAMRGALTAGVPVVGVLGCGADIVYPHANRALFADVERCGCLLTEFPPGTPPIGWNFPRRNRIISGLSCGVLIIEAPEKSGALITAHQAADQGRDVFVVPGNIDVDTCKGSNALLRDGAIAVSSGWDVLSEYAAQFADKIHKNTAPAKMTTYPDELAIVEKEREKPLKVAQTPKTPKGKRDSASKKKKTVDNGAATPYSDAEENRPVLTAEEETIIALVRRNVTLVDDIMSQTDMSAGQVLANLTMLEIKGVIKSLPGKRVILKTSSETE